jgi:hypothetical protein
MIRNALRRGLLVFVGFTLPIEGLGTFSLAGFAMTPNKVATALLLAFALVNWPLTGRAIPWDRKHPWVIAFFVFGVGLAAIQSVVKGGFPVSILIKLIVSFVAVGLFYFLIPYVVTSRRDLNVFLGSLAVGAIFAVGASFVFGEVRHEVSGRFTGSTTNPNILANNLVAILPMSFALFFSSKMGLRKLVLLGSVVISTGGIVATASRSAFLSLVGMWGFWALRFRRLDAIKYIVPTIFLAIGVSFTLPDRFQERVLGMANPDFVEHLDRESRWVRGYWGLRTFVEHPLAGVGLQQFPLHMAREYQLSHGVIHNTYLNVAADMGILGLIPLMVLMTMAWRDFSRVVHTERRWRGLGDPDLTEIGQRAAFIQIAYLGTLIAALFHPTLRDKPVWLLLGLSSTVVALARARVTELQGAESAPSPEASPPHRVGAAPVPGASVARPGR